MNMPEKKFPTNQDAHMRIDGGIGMYRGRPVRISLEGAQAHLYDLITSTIDAPTLIVDMNDEELITKSLPVGYCDVNHSIVKRDTDGYTAGRTKVETVVFFARASYRRQKSVIHPHNLTCSFAIDGLGYAALDIFRFMYSPSFGHMLMNNFSLNRDFSKFKHGEGQALSRTFAVAKKDEKLLLLFNDAEIGSCDDPRFGFKLVPDYRNSLMISRLSQLNIEVF